MSERDVKRFMSAIPRDTENGVKYFALYTSFLYTARRSDEILQLRWGDLSQVTIMEHGQQREIWQYAFYGKGKKMIRDQAELPEPAIRALLHYLRFSGRLATIQPGDAIWTTDTTYIGRDGYDPKRSLNHSAIWMAA